MDEPLPGDVAAPDTSEPSPAPVNSPRRSKRTRWVLLVLLLIVGLTVFVILQRSQKATAVASKAATPQPVIAISTAIAEQGSIGVYINGLGSVTPLSTVTVKSRVDGQLMSVNYR